MIVPVQLDVVLPVYNEGRTIAATLRSIAAAVAPVTSFRFVIAEDPGLDDSHAVLLTLQGELPITVAGADRRRGYSRAMRDALSMTTAPFVLCIDSDGQYDPADIERLWALRERADIVSGSRGHRAEGLVRRIGSRLFGLVLRAVVPLPTSDPSSSFVLMTRGAVERVVPAVGFLPEAFWWEVKAEALRAGCSFIEVPVRHYPRRGSATQIFAPAKLPGVVFRQGVGLVRMLRARRSPE